MSLDECRTLALWNRLPEILYASLLKAKTGRGVSSRDAAALSGVAVGAWPVTYQDVARETAYWYNRIDSNLRAAGLAIRAYGDGTMTRRYVTGWLDWARTEIDKSREALWKGGATDAGDALVLFSERIAQAARNVGSGAGDGFRDFWGLPPIGVAAIGIAGAIAITLIGGGVLTAGALGPLGKGIGVGISRVPAQIPKLVAFRYGG